MSDYLTKRAREKREKRARAHRRIRSRLRGTAERPRLAVFKSLKHIYAQLIDDDAGRTLAQASTVDGALRGEVSGANKTSATAVGKAIAERAKTQGIASVVFDRGGYIYHGKVRAVAEAAREGGLEF
jgi:large subunit ribosomal protein L18